jgi:AraC-like DNA-binding protein
MEKTRKRCISAKPRYARVPTTQIREVASYLRSRGLAADSEQATELLNKLLDLPGKASAQRMSVSHASKLLHVSRRTLGRHCTAFGLPTPSHILVLGRILHTIRVVQETGRPFMSVAPATGWPDPFTLSNAMQKFVGMRPTAARTKGLIAIAEAWLQKEIESGNAELRQAPSPQCPSCGHAVA